MDVSEILSSEFIDELSVGGRSVSLSGWLVVINGDLYLIEDGYSDPYWDSGKVKICNSKIAFAVRGCISPLGGGSSFVFHRARLSGVVRNLPPLVIDVAGVELEGDVPGEWISVDISAANIESCRLKYGDHILRATPQEFGDWLDNFD